MNLRKDKGKQYLVEIIKQPQTKDSLLVLSAKENEEYKRRLTFLIHSVTDSNLVGPILNYLGWKYEGFVGTKERRYVSVVHTKDKTIFHVDSILAEIIERAVKRYRELKTLRGMNELTETLMYYFGREDLEGLLKILKLGAS